MREHHALLELNMPPKNVPPSVKLNAFSCPRCGALADQSWFDVYARQVDTIPNLVDEESLALFIDSVEVMEKEEDKDYSGLKQRFKRAAKGDVFLAQDQDTIWHPNLLHNI